MTATANGINVLSGTLSMPRVGAWRADLDLEVSDAAKVTGPVTVAIDGTTWLGTAADVGAFADRTRVRVVGGAGGLAKSAGPQFYHAIPGRVVVEDLLAIAGEKLSPTSDMARLGAILSFWTRPAGEVRELLVQIFEELGVDWRILPDGTLWAGVDTWTAAAVPLDTPVLDERAHEGSVVIAEAAPTLLPGTTYRGRRVRELTLNVDAQASRTTAFFETATGGSGDAIRDGLERIVRQATAHVDYYAIYAGKVVAQNADGTLEIRPDAAHMPGFSRIPIAYGVPGISATVASGARVHVKFEQGSPAHPKAEVIDPTALKAITVKASQKVTIDAPEIVAQNGRPLARVGDMVQVVSTPPGTPAIGQIMTGNNQHRG